METTSELDEEMESWRGFRWTLRKEDRELWEEMIQQVRQYYAQAVERSAKPFAIEPFFMSLILAQQKMIVWLKAELEKPKAWS